MAGSASCNTRNDTANRVSTTVSEFSITDPKWITTSKCVKEQTWHDWVLCVHQAEGSLLCTTKSAVGNAHPAGACIPTLMRSVLIAAKPPDLMLSSMSPAKKLDCH